MGILDSIFGGRDKPAEEPGALVPKEKSGQPPPDPTAGLDPNANPSDIPARAEPEAVQLSNEEQNDIRLLLRQKLIESDTARRLDLRRIMRGRDYFNGRMDLVWDDGLRTNIPVSQINLSDYNLEDEQTDVDATLNFNVYQATGLYLISAFSAGHPTIRFRPKDAANELDRQTADASNDILDLFYRTNNIQAKQNRMGLYHYTDGVWYAYTRHVVDGQRFGTHQEPIIQPVPTEIKPAGVTCTNCGNETPVSELQPIVEGGPPGCATCGAPLDPANASPPVTAMVPQQVGVREVSNGAEVMDLYGVPEIRTPPEASDVPECGYICLQTEVDIAFLKARYPNLADKIRTGMTLGEESLGEERLARLSLRGGATALSGYGSIDSFNKKITWTRAWLRPYMFWGLEDAEKTKRLLSLYPKGIFVSYAGDLFCEERNEGMDDCWTKCHAYPGDGMIRPAIGEVLLDPQDAVNDLLDSEMQAARHAVPFVIMNEELMSSDNLKNSQIRGGQFYPVQMKGDKSLGEQVLLTGTPAMPSGVSELRQNIFGNISQWLSGALPGLTGQGDANLETARAYAQAREQALGRLGVPWQNTKEAFVRIAEQAVKQFIENRTEDVVVSQMTPIGFENKTIKLQSLQGQAVAYAEVDEAYPVTSADKKDNINKLATSGIPAYQAILQSPENFEVIKSLNNIAGLKFPGEQAGKKQLREIKKLLEDGKMGVGPIMPPPMPMPPPDMGMPPGMPPEGMPPGAPPGMPPMPMMPPPEPQSSVPISLKTDDHQSEFTAGQNWLASDEGFQEQQTNPQGYLNVQAHVAAHFDAMNPPMPPPGMGPPPGPQGPPQ